MKKMSFLKAMSSAVASLCLISAGSIAANADAVQELMIPEITASMSLEAFMRASGYTDQQIKQVRAMNASVDHYIAYFNITDDPNLLDDFYMYSAGVTAQVGWASTQSYDGFVVNDDLVFSNHTVSATSPYIHRERVLFSANPNFTIDCYSLIRYKFHGSGSISTYAYNLIDFTPAEFNNVDDYFSSGKVEAGNITKYISGGTDTSSTIDYSDVTRLLQHVGDVNSGLSDPNWTDEAAVAADLNFDGVVNASDVQMIIAYVTDNTAFW